MFAVLCRARVGIIFLPDKADTDTATAGARLLTLCTPMFSDVKLPSSDAQYCQRNTRANNRAFRPSASGRHSLVRHRRPYDTLGEVIGTRGDAGGGSLRDFDVDYDEIPLLGDGFGGIDYNSLAAKLSGDVAHRIKVVFAQRSRGYCSRSSLTAAELSALTEFVRARSSAYVVIDNCYGEFTEDKEPTADLIIGSLIKNPGGGLAMSGGYLAGTARAVELAVIQAHLPGIGAEVGATLGQNRHILQGFLWRRIR